MIKILLLSITVFGSVIVYAQSNKPNIIYILADDLGYSELGCYGNHFNETPELDKMASQGLRFTNFYAAAPVCSPYRAALMTGQYPARLGINDYLRPNAGQHLDEKHITLAEMLKLNGYRTGIIGKWHLSGYVKEGAPVESLPGKHGFDEVLTSENRGIAEGVYYHPYFWNKELEKKLPGEREYLTDRQNQEAVEFIERNRDKPFFLYLSHYAVHTAVHGKPELVDYFRNKKGAGKSSATKKNPQNDPYLMYSEDTWAKTNNPHLAAQLKVVDEGVGMILQKLKETGLDQNTIVIFTSDNGGETRVTSNAPLRGGKSMLYEGGIREPFLVWGTPIIQKNKTASQRLVNYDIYPTLMQLAGIKNNSQLVDGKSFAGILSNINYKMPKRNLYWHYPLEKPHFLGGRSSGCIISGDWKLIEFFDDNTIELYNLKIDPEEKINLAQKNPSKLRSLQKDLKNWRQQMGY